MQWQKKRKLDHERLEPTVSVSTKILNARLEDPSKVLKFRSVLRTTVTEFPDIKG